MNALTFLFKQVPYDLLGLFVIPIACACTKPESDTLAFGNAWTDYHYGANGDFYWQRANPDFRSRYKRMLWCFRNSNKWLIENYGLVTKDIASVSYTGNKDVRNKPKGVSGKLEIFVTMKDGTVHSAKYVVKQWGNSGRCFRSYTGYKLKDFLDNPLTDRERIAPVFSINPLMGFDNE